MTFSPKLLTHSLRSHALAVRTGVRAGGHGGPVTAPSGVGGQHSLLPPPAHLAGSDTFLASSNGLQSYQKTSHDSSQGPQGQ